LTEWKGTKVAEQRCRLLYKKSHQSIP